MSTLTSIQTFIQVSTSVGEKIKTCSSKRKMLHSVFEDDMITYVENRQKIYKNSPRTFNK